MQKDRPDKRPLSLQFANALDGVFSDRQVISPVQLRRAFIALDPMFRGVRQHDSHEFLRSLLNHLHEELKYSQFFSDPSEEKEKKKGRSPSNLRTSSSSSSTASSSTWSSSTSSTLKNSSAEDACSTAKSKVLEEEHSIVSETFEGELCSQIRCANCNNTSTTLDRFWDVSLSIPSNEVLDEIRSAKALSQVGSLRRFTNWVGITSTVVHLEECLKAFCLTEKLEEDECPTCEKCKHKKDASKTLRLVQAPEILCLHIKRFRYSSVLSSKLSNHVIFPLNGLDVALFFTRKTVEKEGEMLYDLVGIVCHSGGLGMGHYIAYVRNPITQKWYLCNDSYVSEVTAETVQNAQAYILFYQRSASKEKLSEVNTVTTLLRKISRAKNPSESASIPTTYVSKRWWIRWRTSLRPGPITNTDVVCAHGGMQTRHQVPIRDLVKQIPLEVFELLSRRYGGGPRITSLELCADCEELDRQRSAEVNYIRSLDRTKVQPGDTWYLVTEKWITRWRNYVSGTSPHHPGPITNLDLFDADAKTLRRNLSPTLHYRGVVPKIYKYWVKTYGGGPPLCRAKIDIYGPDLLAEGSPVVPRATKVQLTSSSSSSSSSSHLCGSSS